ncbi:MAG: hypothetical protein LBG80_01695 [Bacteroidales bacterium]|jgi:hypothetical protein|nr:hypothetical protein [Bacteroidales bacterium]
MKKKFVFIIIIGIFVFILDSCFSTEHYVIKNIDVFGVKLLNNTEEDLNKHFEIIEDTLKNRLGFLIFGKTEYIYGHLPSLFHECYATTVPKQLDNSIDINSLELILDKDIIFEGNIIKKNTSLWNHPLLKEYQWYYEYPYEYPRLGYSVVIGFNENFYDKVSLSSANYRITISCTTTDSYKLSKTINLFIIL